MALSLSTSDVITIAGIGASVGSVVWALYERGQSRDAKLETKRFRHLLLKQQISQQFADVPNRAMTLFRHVRAKQWDQGAEAALLLSSDLASLNGIQHGLIGEPNKNQLVTALSVMGEMNRRMPRGGLLPVAEIETELMDGCNVILVTVNAIERSLRISAALGGDEDGN